MGEINYEPIIRDMTWSYSRIKSFEDCPYRWYLRYIRRLKGKDMFFASYGTFIHKLLEMYYKGEKNANQLYHTYLQDFKSEVKGFAPNKKVFTSYFFGGLSYLKDFKPLPCHPIAIEKQVKFEYNGIPFVGYIDFLGEKDGKLFVVDNKSRNLKPRSQKSPPTKADKELDSYLRQLYLYSIPIEKEYGKLPDSLCFNCFRVPAFVQEPFQKKAYEESKKWLSQRVEEILTETDFKPNMEFFKCKHLCEMQDHCEYYNLSKG